MYIRAATHSLIRDAVTMNLNDGSMWMMVVLDLRMAEIALAATSMTIAVAVMVIAFGIAANHLLMTCASVHPKIGH